MDIGVTLEELIEGVQLEIGHSTNPAVGVNFRDHIAAAIRREYRRLHADFAWPHLLGWETIVLAPGAVTAARTDGKSTHNIVKAYHKLGTGQWHEIDRNLSPLDYNEVDTDAGARRDPVEKWRVEGQTLAIWPSPVSAGKLRLIVKSERLPLLAPTDICDLDSDLVILFASANLLFRSGKDSAGPTLGRARNAYDTLKQRSQATAAKVALG